MDCRKCKKQIPDDARYCQYCGTDQQSKKNNRVRGNGQGYVYQRGKTWTAFRVLGYETGTDGNVHKRTRSKGGFKTKRDAVNYLSKLDTYAERQPMTLLKIYEDWLPTHRVGRDTMNCYKSAWKYFRPVAFYRIKDITIDDLQDCVDECPHGKRTKENMKALCGLLYKYAIPRHQATLNMGQYLVVTGESGSKEGLPLEAVEKIRQAVGVVPYADYVLAQCYLGFRPSEFLALDCSLYSGEDKAFVGGAKTDAGRDRTVTVSPKIQRIVDTLVAGRTEGPVFCSQDGLRLRLEAYRDAFYKVLDACKIDNPITTDKGISKHKYTPHSCRHTFATMMKAVKAPDKDKLELIGHTSTEMLRHYQDVSLEDLRRITDAL